MLFVGVIMVVVLLAKANKRIIFKRACFRCVLYQNRIILLKCFLCYFCLANKTTITEKPTPYTIKVDTNLTMKLFS